MNDSTAVVFVVFWILFMTTIEIVKYKNRRK